MLNTVKFTEQYVFGLDIGTRSIVGTVGYMDKHGFHVVAMETKEHDTRAMIDGQVHDIAQVAKEIEGVKDILEKRIGRPLKQVCIAAAGRVLRTITVHAEKNFDEERRVTDEDIYNLDFSGVELAHRQINESNDGVNYYCVGYTPIKYYINDYEISNIEGHKGYRIAADILATFLPEDVVDGLYASVQAAGLEVANLTLEPIAAMNVAIPEQYRLLNIALVDVGAGTSDICITKDGSVIAYGMIPYAGDEISEVIAKHFLVDFKQAEKLKMAAGNARKQIAFKDILGNKFSVTPQEIMDIANPVTEKITRSVADKIIELNGQRPVSAVFIVGGGGKIPGFTKSLSKFLSLPEERVAIRGKEVLESVEFAIDNLKKDSLYVTPVGICINYYNQRNNFIYVTVNGERVKLYDNSRLTVVDAIMQVGYPNEKLFPRRGTPINYTLNGVSRMIRGEAGEAAKITLNGKEASMNTPVEKNDYIDVAESTPGAIGHMLIGELPEYRSTISFVINGRNVVCPKFAYVNGELKDNTYSIAEGDDIVMENYYTLKQLFEFIDIDINGVKVFVNNMPADPATKVYENFSVSYSDIDYLSDDVPEDIAEGNTFSRDTTEITVTVNKTEVTLTGKNRYIVVDILDFYPFDISKLGGSELVLTCNGEKADFSDEITEGAEIEIYWRGEVLV